MKVSEFIRFFGEKNKAMNMILLYDIGDNLQQKVCMPKIFKFCLYIFAQHEDTLALARRSTDLSDN